MNERGQGLIEYAIVLMAVLFVVIILMCSCMFLMQFLTTCS